MTNIKKQEILASLKEQRSKLALVLAQGKLVEKLLSMLEFRKSSNIEPKDVFDVCRAYYAENNPNESHAELIKRIQQKFLMGEKRAHDIILVCEFNTICTEIMDKILDQKLEIGNPFANRKELNELEAHLTDFMKEVAGLGVQQTGTLIRTFKNNIGAAIDEQLGSAAKLSMTR